MTTGYRLGRDLEYRAKRLLEDDGYFVVRAAASKGLVDLVALKAGETLFVQCKRSGSLPPAEWNALFDLALWLGAVPLMAVKGPRGTQFRRLTGRKDGTRRRQPMEPFSADETGEARRCPRSPSCSAAAPPRGSPPSGRRPGSAGPRRRPNQCSPRRARRAGARFRLPRSPSGRRARADP
jgi:Holliday junction resolvase